MGPGISVGKEVMRPGKSVPLNKSFTYVGSRLTTRWAKSPKKQSVGVYF